MTEDNEKLFRIKYKLQAQFGEFTHKEVVHSGDDWGSADALLFGAVIHDKGELFAHFTLMDGDLSGKHDDYKMFMAWCLLTEQLARKSDLPEGFKALCETYLTEIQKKTGVTKGDALN